ncbi:chemotaxis protein CheA [Bradyrhizobium sp. 6(2017)]|uniref:chemotaxis protein CheA n=1 Tax=Bradyrhizobium sp. 6(2017) TaxID=1197460 RepID=UPI0013E167F1|nr:chemotaxis protein CheA [Bradyrhizobium sp. 6(2017)]QIG97352.1 chemotaxis protein CheA [Bradyrhizobium sp. 6(2017)]
MNEFVEQFLLESRELINQAIDDLMALEEKPGDRESLDGAFRAFHTLKGAAGIVEFAAMARTLHAAEDILALLRSSTRPVAPNVLNECLACLDLTSRWLDAMQANGGTPPAAEADADEMIARLVGSMDIDESEMPAAPAPPGGDWLNRLRNAAGDQFSGTLTAVRLAPDPEAFFHGSDPLSAIADLPELLIVDLVLTNPAISLEAMNTFSCNLEILALTKAPIVEIRKALHGFGDRAEICPLIPSGIPARDADHLARATAVLEAQVGLLREDASGGLLGRLSSAGRTSANTLRYLGRSALAGEIEAALAIALAQEKSGPLIAAIERTLETATKSKQSTNIPTVQIVPPRALRVDMDRIDALVKLTGELLVVKNTIGHVAKQLQNHEGPEAIASALHDQHARFDRLTAELQRAVLRIRVLPLRTVFRRFPRLVREIAGDVGKAARLITEGEGTEADATIVDALFEPLLHVLRNALDHGIETSEERTSAGKPAMGTVILRGRQDAENILIEIEDDGAGIDVDRIRTFAAARGIASEEALSAMTDAEAVDLIFAAGFSTAATVTDLSGRGVGMDSVRAAVGRLGGTAAVRSRLGIGTTVSLVLPFSLMMTRVMTVEAAGQAFGLPLDSVVETTIVSRSAIVPIGSGQAFVLRERAIPLINLAEALGLTRDEADLQTAKIVVVSTSGQIGGLEVDRLGERLDVMLKPMEGLLGGMRSVSGTTLLGDGRVLVVLDLQELFA